MTAISVSSDTLKELRQKLERHRAALLEEIREALQQSDSEQYVELAGRVHDREDESVADLLVDVNLATIDGHIRELRENEAALERMRQNSYGLCIECGKSIDIRRLENSPAVSRCYECQTNFERTHPGKTPAL